MGNSNQSSQQKKSDAIDVDLTHPKFANSKLVKVDNEVRVQTIIQAEEKGYDSWMKLLASNQQSSEHLFLPVVSTFSTKNLCGSAGHATLDFPYFPYLLSEEIYNRLGKKTRFQETDLWYLLYSLTAAKDQIRKYGLSSVGDIKTGNIFLNDEGRVKVGCNISWPNEVSVWEKAMDKQLVYMAPEDFDRLSRGEAEVDSYQSQVFAVGLTLLNSGLLIDDSNVPSLFDYKQMRFNYAEYNRRLNQWIATRGYSDILKALVINSCSLHPESRIMQEEIWDMLKMHGKEIQNRQNFVITNAPAKIHEEVKRYREARAKINQVHPVSSLKELETSTVVKHQIAHGVTPATFLGQHPISYPLGQPHSVVQMQGTISSNLQTLQSHELSHEVKRDGERENQ